jgi:hypothetical protein
MEKILYSFNEYIKKVDDDEKTPIGVMRTKYIELNPDIVFNWIDGIKCIDSLDSADSWAWSRFLLREAYALIYKPYGGSFDNLAGLENGGHILIAEWFYNAYYGNRLPSKKPSKFRTEYRVQILSKLGRHVPGFTIEEKEALCSYLLLKNNYMKYKDMFKPNKLLALQIINRFALENTVRFEDAESVLRGYISP